MRLRPAVGVLLFVLISAAAAAAPHRPRAGRQSVGGPNLVFEPTAVVASGFKPGATTYFAGVTIRGEHWQLLRETPAAIVDDAGKHGEARYDLGKELAQRAVWIAVDSASGGYTISCPPTFVLREVDLPPSAIHGNGNGALKRISFDRTRMLVYVIRPGEGMWLGESHDGSKNDADGAADRNVSLDLDTFRPVAGSGAPPDHFRGGDIVFAVDPISLEYFVAKQGQGR